MTPIDNTSPVLGANGYLAEGASWNHDLALQIAKEFGIDAMTQAHWAVVCHLRSHYLRHGTLPWETHICRELGLGKGCLHELFGGPLSAWKIAGLPNPGEEAHAYRLNLETPARRTGSQR